MKLPSNIAIRRSHWLVRVSGGTQVEALILRSDGGFLVRYRDGSTAMAVVEASTFVSVPLVVLRYRIDGATKSLALVTAAMGIEGHRQLRVWLRWRAQTGAINAAG